MTEPVLEFSFAGGIDESIRNELVDPSRSFLVLNNTRQAVKGGDEKRRGYTSLALTRMSGSRSSGLSCFDHKGIPCVIDASNTLDTYSTATSRWVNSGRLPNANFEMLDVQGPLPIGSASGGTSVIDVAQIGNYLVTCFAATSLSGGAVAFLLTVQDVSNGTTIRVAEHVSTSSVAECAAALATYAGQYVVLITMDGGSANITAHYLDVASVTTINNGWTSIGNIATDHATSGGNAIIALSAQGLTSAVVFAYVNNSGGASRATVGFVTIAGAGSSATVNTSSTTPTQVAVDGSQSDNIWVAWDEGTSIKVQGLDAGTLSVSATTATLLTLTTSGPGNLGIVRISSTIGSVLASDGSTDRTRIAGFQKSGGATAAYGSSSVIYNCQLASRPFMYDSRLYALFTPDVLGAGSGQRVVLLCDFTADTPASPPSCLRPVCNPEPYLSRASSLGRAHWVGSGKVFYSTLSVTQSGVASIARIIKVDFTPVRSRPVTHGGLTFIEGGVLYTFDGAWLAESGFLYAPPAPGVAVGAAGSLTGDYRYVAVYETQDAAGNWVVSGISEPSDVVQPTSDQVTVTVKPYTLTSRAQGASITPVALVRIAIYRTLAGGETPYYRLTTVKNDVAAATVSYTDNVTDSTLDDNQLLSGVGTLPDDPGSPLERLAPPGLRFLRSYNGMLVGAYGRELWWTPQLVDGEAPWHNPAFSQALDETITGLEIQDGTLYIFTRGAIYAAAGEPANDTGTDGGIGTPRRLGVNRGCTTAASLLATERGIFYRSDLGFELLSRGGQSAEFIGVRVGDTIAAFPTVTSAVFDREVSLVRITLATGETDGLVTGTGVDIVYDMTSNEWVSIDTKASSTPSQHAALLYVAGAWRYCWLHTDGTLYYEKASNAADSNYDGAGTWVTQRAETGWVKITGLQGEQFMDRALLLAKRSASHDLKIYLAFDYGDYGAAKTITSDKIDALTREWLDFEITQTTHQAVKVKIEDAEPTGGGVWGTGKGGTWVALTFHGHPHQKAKRTSGAQRGGT